MSDKAVRELNCVLCKQTYSPVLEPEEDENSYKVHCTSCARWVLISVSDPVRATLREILSVSGEALALAVQSMLAQCPCGSEFNHDSGKRCPECLTKIKKQTKDSFAPPSDFYCIWDLKKLKDLEAKIFSWILEKMEVKEETLSQLIERFEAGKVSPEEYMEGIENIPLRESRQMSVIQTWAMVVGPEMIFHAADEHGLVEHYGARILVSLAKGLERGYGKSVLSTLTKESQNLHGVAAKEIGIFLKKIAGGF